MPLPSRISASAATLTVARYVLVEARRSGLPWLAAGSIAAALALAGFLSRVAITEAGALQLAAAGALLRACAVFLILTHVVASVAREANDKGVELALALPLSRPAWYAGKLLGFAATGALMAAAFALPLLLWAKGADAGAWALSLAAECALVSAAALFFASAFSQTVPAIAAGAGLYLLARALPAMQSIAAGPHASEGGGGEAARWLLDLLALLLPRLEQATRAEWLLYGAPPAGLLAQVVAAMGLYWLLLGAAGLIDFGRRNF